MKIIKKKDKFLRKKLKQFLLSALVVFSIGLVSAEANGYELEAGNEIVMQGSKVEFVFGLREIENTEGKKLGSMGITIIGLSNKFSFNKDNDCQVTSLISDWSAIGGNIDRYGTVKIATSGASNPLSQDDSSIVKMVCRAGNIKKSEIKVRTQITNEKSEIFYLDDKSIVIRGEKRSASSGNEYSLSGYVRDSVNNVIEGAKVYCGDYTVVSATDGSFNITELPNKYNCVLGTVKAQYSFITQSVRINNSDINNLVLRGEFRGAGEAVGNQENRNESRRISDGNKTSSEEKNRNENSQVKAAETSKQEVIVKSSSDGNRERVLYILVGCGLSILVFALVQIARFILNKKRDDFS